MNPTSSNLDRFFCFDDWEDVFSAVKAMVILRSVFDHLPIFHGGGELSLGPKPFDFNLCG